MKAMKGMTQLSSASESLSVLVAVVCGTEWWLE